MVNLHTCVALHSTLSLAHPEFPSTGHIKSTLSFCLWWLMDQILQLQTHACPLWLLWSKEAKAGVLWWVCSSWWQPWVPGQHSGVSGLIIMGRKPASCPSYTDLASILLRSSLPQNSSLSASCCIHCLPGERWSHKPRAGCQRSSLREEGHSSQKRRNGCGPFAKHTGQGEGPENRYMYRGTS